MNNNITSNNSDIQIKQKKDYGVMLVDGIIVVSVYCPIVTIDIAKNIVRDRLLLAKGKQFPLLVDLGKSLGGNEESKKYFMANHKQISAIAYILNGEITQLNFEILQEFMKSRAIPIRAFKAGQKEEALRWLHNVKG